MSPLFLDHLKPSWTVNIGNATITLHPDYVRTVTQGRRKTLIVERLNFGESPNQIKELIYTLYEEAALQNRSEETVRTEIKASFMTNRVTLPVPISVSVREDGIRNYQNAVDGINRGEFFARPNKDCSFCSYYFICSVRQR